MARRPLTLTRYYLMLLMWLALAVSDVWASLRHWWWMTVPLGLFGMPLAFSLSQKLMLDKWPDWKGVWRMLKDYGYVGKRRD